MKTGVGIAIIACLYLVVSEMDYRDAVAAQAERQCLAKKKNQRAVSEMQQNGSVTCVRYDGIGDGMAPRMVSVDLWGAK